MTDNKLKASSPKKKRWLRLLGWVFGILIILLVVVYFVATSSAFLTGFILPRVSKSINADITVADASIHPFSGIVLNNLKIQAKDQAPLLTAQEVRVSYHLFDIMHGNIHVDEVAIVSPTIQLVENPDGTRNVDSLLKSQQSTKPSEPKPAESSKASKPLQIDVGKVSLSNVTILQIKNYKNGNQDLMELTNVNLTLSDLKNGQNGKLQLGAEIHMSQNPPGGTNSSLVAALNGSFDLSPSADLKSAGIKGNTTLDVSQAGGALANLNAFGLRFDCDLTPTEVKQLALSFLKSGTPLGQLSVSGPLDMQKLEGNLSVALTGIDHRLLNLAAAGVDFGATTISCTNVIQLAKSGSAITASGRLGADKIQLTRAGQVTPTLDFRAAYDVSVDRNANTAQLRALTLTGTQNGKPLLNARLNNPMDLAWGASANAVGDAKLELVVTNVSVADWKSVLGSNPAAGEVGLQMSVSSQQGGKQIGVDLSSQIVNLTATVGSNQVSQLGINLKAHCEAANFKEATLSGCTLQVSHGNQSLLSTSASGTYNLADGSADVIVKLQTALANLLQAFPQPGLDVADGDVTLNAHVTQKQKTQSVTGDLAFNNFTARIGQSDLRNFAGSINLAVNNSPGQIQIEKMDGSLTQGGNPGGSFGLSGSYDLSNKVARLSAKLKDFNQGVLGPFLQPALADKKLVSIGINANADVQYDPDSSSTVKAAVQIANLVVNDPQKKFPDTALEAKLNLDAALLKQALDLHSLQVTLTPTSRADNQVQLAGHIDFSQTNALQGNLKLSANALDMTSYYDLFAAKKPASPSSTTSAAANAPASAGSSQPTQEPAPVSLPFHNFTANLSIGQLYLHEVAITNWQASVQLDEHHVLLKPFQLALNGAPVSVNADVDLGVPGYVYKLDFNATKIPLTPLVDTFQSDRAGQLGGFTTASAQINGAGITGVNLQKNLQAQFNVVSTNLNYSIANVRSKVINSILNVIVGLPEIIGRLSGSGGGQLDWADQLTAAPINLISADGSAGNGVITLKNATVQSTAFQVIANGTVTIASILTNSALEIPVQVALSRPMASQIGMVSSDTPTNAVYAALPQFLRVLGTAGNPKTEIKKTVLLQVAAKSTLGIAGRIGQAAGGDAQKGLGTIGGLLGLGHGSANSNTNSATQTNQPAKKGLLNGLFGK